MQLYIINKYIAAFYSINKVGKLSFSSFEFVEIFFTI